jgi:hypothetical protein
MKMRAFYLAYLQIEFLFLVLNVEKLVGNSNCIGLTAHMILLKHQMILHSPLFYLPPSPISAPDVLFYNVPSDLATDKKFGFAQIVLS